MILQDWAQRHNIPNEAIEDLLHELGAFGVPDCKSKGPEQLVQNEVRLEASRKGHILWRNNSGVTEKHVRYGLCNDSARVNKRLKSADLVGVRKKVVTRSMVGQPFGLFLTREIKKPGWRFNPKDDKEVAQLRWLLLVLAMGGDAAFTDTVGSI